MIPLPVLAQAWRLLAQAWQPGRWTPLTRLIPECVVFGARSAEPPPCGVCQGGHVADDAKRVGQLLAPAGLSDENRPDAVDALAVVVAARHPEAVVVTSDPRDLCAYRDALDGRRGRADSAGAGAGGVPRGQARAALSRPVPAGRR
ncbi:hypothetical protein OG775_34870 [Streptomyces platensis]|uniref:hypothetical protein n=1 Tax=Streptomyces platensis TaxID=58346 RepID=UPI002252F88F|nr:hypothetical protein [Streptomyces platensis]MCX4640232.1 hypothetical protein [Streptomyces platensis]